MNKIEGVPDGWELVAIRPPEKGEFVLYNVDPCEWVVETPMVAFPIVRKIEPPLQLREGGWYERRDGKIVGPVKKTDWTDSIEFLCNGLTYWSNGDRDRNRGQSPIDLIREVEPSKPVIDPGDGWRLLDLHEALHDGDMIWTGREWFPIGNPSCRLMKETYRRRIAPKYRPFANAAEFMPHRDRWIGKKDSSARFRVFGYDNEFCSFFEQTATYQEVFDDFTFADDGTPCGVKV